jgi:hypothetical protein
MQHFLHITVTVTGILPHATTETRPLSVSFNVNGDLESDVNIYMTIAVTNGEILVSTQSMDLCENMLELRAQHPVPTAFL